MIEDKLIYLSDDDQDDRELFTEALTEAYIGYKLVTTCNGQELLEELQVNTNLPDVIFLDINMPVKNGIETLKELRRQPRTAHLPVVMYSTSSDTQLIHTAKLLGANFYFVKPTDFNYLKGKLTEIITVITTGKASPDFLLS